MTPLGSTPLPYNTPNEPFVLLEDAQPISTAPKDRVIAIIDTTAQRPTWYRARYRSPSKEVKAVWFVGRSAALLTPTHWRDVVQTHA